MKRTAVTRLLPLASALLLAAPLALAQPGGQQATDETPLELTWDTAPAPAVILVRHATLWTQDEAGTLEDADMLVRGGRIARIGRGLTAPEGALVIDARGMHVTPGIIDAHSHTAADGINEASNNITAEVRIQDVLNSEQPDIYRQLAGGTTAAQVLHGSANAIGGQSAIVKWRYKVHDPLRMLIDGATPTIKFALGENPKRSAFSLPLPGFPRRYPATRMGVANSIRRAFLRARDYRDEWRAYEALSDADRERTAPPRRDLQLEALAEILEGRRIVHAHSYRQDEIIMLIRLAEEMGFRIGAFQHVLEGYKARYEIAAHGAGASTFSDWWGYKFEVYDAIPYNGPLMHDAGVVVSYNSDDAELARHLNLEAAKAVKYGGLSDEEALAFVTSNPAEQLRLFDRIGSLREGKDADFVVWNGHPLSIYSRVQMTFVDGRKVFDRQLDARIQRARAAEKERLVAAVKGEGGKQEQETATAGAPTEAGERAAEAAPHRFPDPTPRGYVPAPRRPAEPVAIVGATVHTVSHGEIPDGVVVFADGTITAVGGRDTAIPDGARRIDATGKHLFPGMIAADSVIGLIEIGNGVPGSVDTDEIDEFNSDLRAEVAVNASSEHIAVTRANGVTHVLTIPRGGTITGASALLRLQGWSWEEMTALSRAGMHMSFPGGGGFSFFGPPPSEEQIEKQRKEALEKVDRLLEAARAYRRAKRAEADGGPHHDTDVKLEGLLPLLEGTMPLVVHTHGARDIVAALEWAAGHDLHLVIVDSGDTWRAAERLAAANVPVILSTVMALPPYEDDPYDAMYANAARLHEAGVRFAIADGPSGPGTDDRNLPYQAGMAAAFGLPREAALRAVTLAPAEILGVDDRLGSIDVGKSASLVLADGDLLEIRTQILGEWIDGVEVDLSSRHTRLRDRWSRRPPPQPHR